MLVACIYDLCHEDFKLVRRGRETDEIRIKNDYPGLKYKKEDWMHGS